METRDFGWAIRQMKNGQCVAREGWNGKNMFVFLRNGRIIKNVNGPMLHVGGVDTFEVLPHICMRAADGKLVAGWLASQTDMLSEDWGIVESID